MNIKKQIYKNVFGVVAVGMGMLCSCSDDFLAEKQPYGSFGPDLVYGDKSAVKLRLNYIYQRSLPYFKGANTGGGRQVDNCPPDFWPVGLPDLWSNNTDEFPGYGAYTNPGNTWDNSTIHKYFFFGINESPWKKMRECTDVIVGVNEAENSNLLENEKHEVEAQARFFRATRYYRLFKRFGGVPLVRGLQSTLMGDRDSLAIPRHSTAETVRFILDDLEYAGRILPTRWEEEANDWGRITSGCAYAMAGIVANYYASPVFNRADDAARWDTAYALNTLAKEKLTEGHFGLSYANNPGVNASNWARIWCNMMGGETLNSEAVYIAICNNVEGENDLYNCWEQSVRPSNANGGGGIEPSAEMVDEFPMADGKRPTEAGKYNYNKKLFFLNRDPRFYRTFAFPGIKWEFSGTIGSDRADQCPYLSGNDYELWNIAWYPSASDASIVNQSGYFTDLLGSSGKGLYVKKKSQDLLLGEKALYNFQNDGGFKMNGQPLLAIRYTEVLLNLAEAACGVNKLDEAWDILTQIRKRAGLSEENNYGLDPAIRTDRAKMFEAILYERKIELAYEGKRFDDCMRWMLFDGGEGQGAISQTYALTGWGGNTCNYLGVKPLKDKLLHKIEMYIDPAVFTGAKSPDVDPFTTGKLKKPAALDLTEDMTATTVEEEDGTSTMTFANKKVQALAQFYMQYLQRKDIVDMDYNNEMDNPPTWDPKLYLMGLEQSDQENNPGVVQTIGWQSRFGGMGVFDPLSDHPQTSITTEEDEPVVNDSTSVAK